MPKTTIDIGKIAMSSNDDLLLKRPQHENHYITRTSDDRSPTSVCNLDDNFNFTSSDGFQKTDIFSPRPVKPQSHVSHLPLDHCKLLKTSSNDSYFDQPMDTDRHSTPRMLCRTPANSCAALDTTSDDIELVQDDSTPLATPLMKLLRNLPRLTISTTPPSSRGSSPTSSPLNSQAQSPIKGCNLPLIPLQHKSTSPLGKSPTRLSALSDSGMHGDKMSTGEGIASPSNVRWVKPASWSADYCSEEVREQLPCSPSKLAMSRRLPPRTLPPLAVM